MRLISGKFFNVVEVPLDGACLFTSISHALFEHPECARDLRTEIAQYIANNWDIFQQETDSGSGIPYVDAESYLADMLKYTTWGSAAEVQAAALLYNVCVNVVQGDHIVQVYNPHSLANIYLLFEPVRQHYSCLVEAAVPPSPEEASDSESHDITLDEDTDFQEIPEVIEEEDLFSDECLSAPGSQPRADHPDGLERRHQVKELPGYSSKKPSVALPRGQFGDHFLWAYSFRGEDCKNVESVSLGAFDVTCPNEQCGARFWHGERLCASAEVPFWCCGKTVRCHLTAMGVLREEQDPAIHELYYGDSEQAKHFRDHIRSYNYALSTATPSVNYTNINCREGKTVVVNGKVTFRAPSFPTVQEDGLPSLPGQLFFVDMSENVVEKRRSLSTDKDIRVDVLQMLERYLRAHNDLIRTFEHAARVQHENAGERIMLLVNPHRDGGLRVTERSVFELEDGGSRPDGSECVAAVYSGERVPYHYDMIFHPRGIGENDPPHMKVHEASPTLDVMLYPLIHLHCEDPWLDVVVSSKRAKKPKLATDLSTDCGTIRAYYSSRIMQRLIGSDRLFRCRGLFQQWLCDAALKIIDNNLRYAEKNVEAINVCRSDTLRRFVEDESENLGKQPGRIVLMPRNEQKSERRMYANYMDAVRISGEFGSPTFFHTFTVNPKWPEILEGLEQRGLSPNEYVHAPDLVVRVYLSRLGVFLSDLVNKSVVGRTLAYVGVHEFTHTKLPHFHVAQIIHENDRPITPEEIDALISAEIPDMEEDEELHRLVMSFMIHKPCDGSISSYKNPYCRPDPTKPCKHGFPFKFSETSELTGKGATYRRRQGSSYWHSGYRCFVDNSWVIPHIRKFIKRYKNHLNSLACGKGILFKYLFGYMEKESTGQHVQGSMYRWATENAGDTLHWDEVEHFRSLRCVGPYEAVFRILAIPFKLVSHSVVSMPIHLPEQGLIYYKGPVCDDQLLHRDSKLEAWFKLNQNDEFARTLYYADVPKYYTWKDGSWIRRKVEYAVLGRLMHVNPTPRLMDLFNLRMLLLNRPGMKSWEELLTVGETICTNFRAATTALGLATGEGRGFDFALGEVVTHGNARQIRSFFAVLISNCFLKNISELWLKHRDEMSADFTRRGCGKREAYCKARQAILNMVQETSDEGIQGLDAELTVPHRTVAGEELNEEVPDGSDAQEIADEAEDNTNIGSSQAGYDLDGYFSSLNEGQRTAHRTVMASVLGTSKLFTLLAPAGTGKTYLYCGLYQDCKSRGLSVVCTAFTAIAALLLPEGDTCHKVFGIPIRPSSVRGTERSYLERVSPDAVRLQSCSLIIIDEVSMLSSWQLTLIDHFLQMVMDSSLPFGGKTVILGGDMAQVLPVMRGYSALQVAAYAVTTLPVWGTADRLSLTENMRANDDREFANWLLKVRDGSANFKGDDIIIPEEYLVTVQTPADQSEAISESNLVEKMIEKVYGDMSEEKLQSSVILAPTNDIVRSVNERVLRSLPGDSPQHTFYSKTTMSHEDQAGQGTRIVPLPDDSTAHEIPRGQAEFPVTVDALQDIKRPNLPPHILNLKVGAIVMLLINLNKKRGLCNGTRLLVTGIFKESVRVKRIVPFLDETEEFFIPKMSLRSDDTPVPGTIIRHQFPIALGFAFTVNKGQGQTFKTVGLLLKRPVFAHGQFYVGVSRAKTGKSLFIGVIKGPNQGPIGFLRGGGRAAYCNIKTKNIVIRSLLV